MKNQYNCSKKTFYSYRIEKAINMQNNVHQKNKIVMYKGIIYAVDIHRTAMKLVFI